MSDFLTRSGEKRIFWAENVAFMKISLPWLDALILGSDYRLKHCWVGQKVASEPMSGLFFALNEGADATVLVKSDQWSRNKIILKPLVQNYLSTYHRVRHKPFIFSHRVSTRECKERGCRDLRPDFRKSSATCLFFHLGHFSHFLRCAFSNISSNCLHERMLSRLVDFSLVWVLKWEARQRLSEFSTHLSTFPSLSLKYFF